MVDKKSFYNTTLADKGIIHVGHLFDTNGAMKPWSVFKSKSSLIISNHFYWIQLNKAIQKGWKENLCKEDKNWRDLTLSGHHIIKKYQIYSLTKCNSRDSCSLKVSLNETKTKSQIYFEKHFQNKEIEWKCIYLMSHRVTIEMNLHIYQYKLFYFK